MEWSHDEEVWLPLTVILIGGYLTIWNKKKKTYLPLEEDLLHHHVSDLHPHLGRRQYSSVVQPLSLESDNYGGVNTRRQET